MECLRAVKGDFGALSVFNFGSNVLVLAAPKPGPHVADIDEAIAAMDPNEEVPELTFGCTRAPDDDLMSRAALRLRPCVRAPRDVSRIANASIRFLEGQPAGRAQHRFPAVLENLDEAKTGVVARF